MNCNYKYISLLFHNVTATAGNVNITNITVTSAITCYFYYGLMRYPRATGTILVD